MRALLHQPLLGFTVLLAFQWLGEAVARLSGLPVPGSVLGMIGLFLLLLFLGRVPGAIQASSHTLLSNLTLLFVPAAVGAMLRLSGFLDQIPAVLFLIMTSTLVTLAVVAGALQWMNLRSLR